MHRGQIPPDPLCLPQSSGSKRLIALRRVYKRMRQMEMINRDIFEFAVRSGEKMATTHINFRNVFGVNIYMTVGLSVNLVDVCYFYGENRDTCALN